MRDRAVRRHHDKRVIENRLKLLREHDNNRPDVTGKTYYEHMVEAPNKLSKRHPYDCGNPKCFCCHSEKIMHKKKISDLRKEPTEDVDESEDL